MFRMQDLGEVGYGGVVTLASWWDGKRIADGKLTEKQILKKAGFWSYLLIGGFATLASQFGWFRRQELWFEHISHGFLYDVPRQVMNAVKSQQTTPNYIHGESEAVREAKEILALRQRELARRTGADITNPEYETILA